MKHFIEAEAIYNENLVSKKAVVRDVFASSSEDNKILEYVVDLLNRTAPKFIVTDKSTGKITEHDALNEAILVYNNIYRK